MVEIKKKKKAGIKIKNTLKKKIYAAFRYIRFYVFYLKSENLKIDKHICEINIALNSFQF